MGQYIVVCDWCFLKKNHCNRYSIIGVSPEIVVATVIILFGDLIRSDVVNRDKECQIVVTYELVTGGELNNAFTVLVGDVGGNDDDVFLVDVNGFVVVDISIFVVTAAFVVGGVDTVSNNAGLVINIGVVVVSFVVDGVVVCFAIVDSLTVAFVEVCIVNG